MRSLVQPVTLVLCVLVAREVRPCTSIMVGRKASADGSVMTSHTCDGHRDRLGHRRGPESAAPARFRAATEQAATTTIVAPCPVMAETPTGRIPQAPETLGYLAPAYAAMNERQVAIGESTFGGRLELVSAKGWIDCETLTRLMLERATTARQAIRIAGDLLKEHGWCDEGEALTIADPKEVWLMEIVGPGKDAVGRGVGRRADSRRPRFRGGQCRADRRDRPCQAGVVPGFRERLQGCPGSRLLGSEERPAVPFLRGL